MIPFFHFSETVQSERCPRAAIEGSGLRGVYLAKDTRSGKEGKKRLS